MHLHVKSCWSLLESPMTIDQIVARSKAEGNSAAVLCDHLTMFGTMDFLHACKKAGLKPVIGLEVRVTDPWDLHFLLYATDNEALQNLYALSSLINTRPEKSLHLQEVIDHSKGCIVVNGGQDDLLLQMADHGQMEEMAELLETLRESFDSFYLAMAMLDSARHAAACKVQKSLARQLSIPTVALSRVDYEKEEDVETVRLMQAIDRQTHLKDAGLFFLFGRYWRSEQEMEALYDPEDLQAAASIIDAVHLDPDHLKQTDLPVFHNKLNLDSESYLRALARAGLKKRMAGRIPEVYEKRLEYELDVICSMGFANYFLIVWDFIREARSRKILVGPGRGSAAGSLVAWCTGITHVDPVANGLLFERFLNPERISMPDIDTDIPDNRRDEVIAYVAERYGKAHVGHIVTFSTFKAKMALRDTGRVLNIHTRELDALCKRIPSVLNITLEQAMESSPAFAKMIHSRPQLEHLYEMARSIEGLPRHISIHAGGIVFSDLPLYRAAPVIDAGAQVPAVQFTMDHLEEIGLIKFDFLGLKNLSIIDDICSLIEQTTGNRPDLFRLPFDDPAVYRLLCSGQTLGVFQLESAGIRNLVVSYQPHRFEDIAAILALYRPGPMKNIGLYLEARKNPARQEVLHPLLEPVLQETYGVFLYQEQIMQAAQIIGRFTLAQADSLRKAMSKKKHDVMESYRSLFLEGAASQKIDAAQASHIFEVMERFADYGFNKSHSYAYGMIVYWMAYLKARFPLQFYASCLQSAISDKSKSAEYLQECRTRHIPLLGVDLNCSFERYTIENGALRLPLGVMKSQGGQLAAKILKERQIRGPFTNIYEAIARLLGAGITQAQIEGLIDAGALDGFGFSRASLRNGLERLIQYGYLIKVEQEDFLLNYDIASPPNLETIRDEAMEKVEREYKVLGFYFSEHPAITWRSRYPKARPISSIKARNGFCALVGRIASSHPHKTKNGSMMVFLSLEDESGSVDAAVMPDLYEKIQLDLKTGALVYLEGQKNRPDSILARHIVFISQNHENPSKK